MAGRLFPYLCLESPWSNCAPTSTQRISLGKENPARSTPDRRNRKDNVLDLPTDRSICCQIVRQTWSNETNKTNNRRQSEVEFVCALDRRQLSAQTPEISWRHRTSFSFRYWMPSVNLAVSQSSHSSMFLLCPQLWHWPAGLNKRPERPFEPSKSHSWLVLTAIWFQPLYTCVC